MKILITAGPTHERIDSVRFISNYSTGKMGFALAEVCASRGYNVVLIAGPVQQQIAHSNVKRIDVESAQEMYTAVIENYPTCDGAILCAAVADFTPTTVASHKLKRGTDHLILELKPTQDIAATVGKLKSNKQFLVGFALETNNEEANAVEKMRRKNFDFIVLNSLNDKNAGFGYDTNKITIFDAHGSKTAFPLKDKKMVAEDIINHLENNLLCR